MSERERWIVYPLLFLALGAALRDKLMQQTRADQLVCQRLVMINESGVATAVLDGDQLKAIKAGVVDAQQLLQRARPIAAKQKPASALSIPQMLKFLQQMGVVRPAPQNPESPPAETPDNEDTPAGEGGKQQALAEPPRP
ncbi:MAG: hypothetical protein AAF589_03610 [Planctomycetota bacterium]